MSLSGAAELQPRFKARWPPRLPFFSATPALSMIPRPGGSICQWSAEGDSLCSHTAWVSQTLALLCDLGQGFGTPPQKTVGLCSSPEETEKGAGSCLAPTSLPWYSLDEELQGCPGGEVGFGHRFPVHRGVQGDPVAHGDKPVTCASPL